jgi:hypothetical protein
MNSDEQGLRETLRQSLLHMLYGALLPIGLPIHARAGMVIGDKAVVMHQ